MSLQNLQVEFLESLLDETAIAPVTPSANMAIYRHNSKITLEKALLNTYPLIVKLVGEDFFNSLAHCYITHYPPRSANLHDYGEYLCDFLSEYEPTLDLIYLPEVARFEWACHRLYFASNHDALDVHLLETFTKEDYHLLHFQLHPALSLQKFHYPILDIIDLCEGNITETIDVDNGGINLILFRPQTEITLIPLTESELVFLTSLHEQKTIAAALQAALKVDPDFMLDEKLPKWIVDKIIVGVYLTKDALP